MQKGGGGNASTHATMKMEIDQTGSGGVGVSHSMAPPQAGGSDHPVAKALASGANGAGGGVGGIEASGVGGPAGAFKVGPMGQRVDSVVNMRDLSPLPSFSQLQTFISPNPSMSPNPSSNAVASAAVPLAGMAGGGPHGVQHGVHYEHTGAGVGASAGGVGGAGGARAGGREGAGAGIAAGAGAGAGVGACPGAAMPASGAPVGSGGIFDRQNSGISTGSFDHAGSGVRPIKRSRIDSEHRHSTEGLPPNEFEGVDLAGISRKFPQEKRLELAARIDASAEAVAGAWAALLLAQTAGAPRPPV